MTKTGMDTFGRRQLFCTLHRHVQARTQGGFGGGGVRKNPPARPQGPLNRTKFYFFLISVYFLWADHAAITLFFSARMHKIAGFGSIFPKIFRGSMPPDPPRRAWASPKHILVRLKTKRTHPSGLLRTAMHVSWQSPTIACHQVLTDSLSGKIDQSHAIHWLQPRDCPPSFRHAQANLRVQKPVKDHACDKLSLKAQ